MNLVGKILVLLILVMSAVFMAFAVLVYSTHTNWKDVVSRPTSGGPTAPLGLKIQLQNARNENAKLQNKITELEDGYKGEVATRDASLAKLETERLQLNNDYTALAATEAKLQEDLRQRTAALEAAQKSLDERNRVVDSLRADVATAQQQRDDHFRKVVELTDQVHDAQGTVQRLEVTNVRLAEQIAKAKQLLERFGKNVDSPIDHLPPKIDGVVLAVGRDGLLEVSIGSDDGLSSGHTLEVYRNNKYLGRVEVLQTQPDKSVAKVIPEMLQGRIEKEDRVATRFN